MQVVIQKKYPRGTIEASQRATGLLHAAVGAIVRLAGGAWAGARTPAERRMQVLETLTLGARKQLLLISCDGERFLVGTGSDQVNSIVRVVREAAAQNETIAESAR